MPRIPASIGLALLFTPALAFADLPEPLDPALFGFPGAHANPASAVSAGVALADRWLGDEPFDNPAIKPARRLRVSPLFLRVSRQDLRADNRRYDEDPGFVEAGGASIVFPIGRAAVALYAAQPTVRREDNAFERGEGGGPVAPAVIQSRTTARELRAGLSASAGSARFLVGAAAEWTRRRDEYLYHEDSGSPDAGDKSATFTGDGVGFQVGARWESPELWGGPLAVGVAGRFRPALDVSGDEIVNSLLRQDSTAIAATLESGLEAGVSVGYSPSRAVGVMMGAGFQQPRDWSGFGVSEGRAFQWSFGFEYHDPEEAWTARLGLGREHQDGGAEPRAGLLGLGVGWRLEGWGLDFAILHRSIERAGHPTSFDDRAIATLRFDL